MVVLTAGPSVPLTLAGRESGVTLQSSRQAVLGADPVCICGSPSVLNSPFHFFPRGKTCRSHNLPTYCKEHE